MLERLKLTVAEELMTRRKSQVEVPMLERLKRFITVGGWKSFAGGALILYSAYLSGTGCIDVSCTQQIGQLYKAGEALLGVGLAHKLQKLNSALALLRDVTEKKP